MTSMEGCDGVEQREARSGWCGPISICAKLYRDRSLGGSTVGVNPVGKKHAPTHPRNPRHGRCASAAARRPGGGAALTLAPVFTAEFIARAEFWAYRVGVFVILNVLDDPAWLALIFC